MQASQEETVKIKNFQKLNSLIGSGNKGQVVKHIEATFTTHACYAQLSFSTHTQLPTYPVCVAAEKGKLDILNFLISKGFCPMCRDVNELHLNGYPIHLACIKGHVNIVRSLIREHHVDVNSADCTGGSPIFWAVGSGCLGVVREIVHSGGDVNAFNPIPLTTPLWNAVRNNMLDISIYLISKGADVNCHNHQGHSPLYISIFKNNKSIAEALLDRGADVNDNHNDQPFMVATGLENIPMMKFLYSRGADPEGRDREGNTPLHRSASSHAYKVTRYLVVDLNVSLFKKNIHDLTPLTLAVQEVDKDIANLLVNAGYHPSQEPWIQDSSHSLLKVADQKFELRPIIKDMRKTARTCPSLQEICSFKIRHILGQRNCLVKAIDSLPLRKCLKDHLKLCHIPHEKPSPSVRNPMNMETIMIPVGDFLVPFQHLTLTT